MKSNWIDKHIVIGIVIAVVISILLNPFFDSFLNPKLVKEDYFEVSEVHVPDFKVGEDPLIFVDRIVKKRIVQNWQVSFHREQENGEWFLICSTKVNQNDYNPDQFIDYVKLFAWWTKEECKHKMVAGEIRMTTTWTANSPVPERFLDPTTRIYSYFEVYQ